MKLEVAGLTKTFPAPLFSGTEPFAALRRASFSSETGLTRVEGPNGSGKTTLFRVLAGILEADDGTILLDSRTAGPEDLRAAASFCPANPRSFHFRLSALENLRFFGALAGLDAGEALARAAALGERFGLRPADLARRFDRLSEGGMQKVNLIRALSRQTPLLLLDEPYRGLDAAAAQALTQLLTELPSGTAALVAGHALPAELKSGKTLRLADGSLTEVPA